MNEYTLTEEAGELVVRRSDGSWVFTLARADRLWAKSIVTTLNAWEGAKA